MEKILFALGHEDLENYIESQIKGSFIVINDAAFYKDAIIKKVKANNPNIVIIRETLQGSENIMSILYEIRTNFPKIRIIFIAKERDVGDEFLATLVNYGIYDIIYSGKTNAKNIISLIKQPNGYREVQHLQPMPVLDEKTNKIIFQAPGEKEVIKEVVIEKEVVVEKIIEKENKIPEADKKIRKNTANKVVTKQKIISFLGSKEGVGNSSLALNTALLLAKEGYKTIFLEFDEKTPSVSYWYEIGFIDKGIDSAIYGIQTDDLKKIKEGIIQTEYLKTLKNSDMIENYKKMPNIDFMFFSNKYLTKGEDSDNIDIIDLKYSKELFLHLLFQMEYDFIILDVSSDISNIVTKNALNHSQKVFITITQDVSTIGYALYKINEIKKMGINVESKFNYIVNKLDKTDLSLKGIEEWLQKSNILSVPYENKDFINSNYRGLPVCLYTKKTEVKKSLNAIKENILK